MAWRSGIQPAPPRIAAVDDGLTVPAPGRTPLLVACALGIERLALRRGAQALDAAGPVALLRTGMGPRAAERAVARALRDDPALRGAAVISAGFCAGVAPGIRPGDVIADTDTDTDARPGPGPARDRDGGDVLVEALELLGCRVHRARITHSDHVVGPAERLRLRASGVSAVDMETAAIRAAARVSGAGPVAAVRVVVDTPEYELPRVGTLRTGLTAFRVLRSVFPAFLEWHRCYCAPPEVS